MKASDITDEEFLVSVAATPPRRGLHCWRLRSDVQRTLEWVVGFEIPEKVFLAKARRLGKRRLLEGCTDCSCRGDYHLPKECYQFGCCYTRDFDWTTHPQWDESWAA